MLMVEQSISWSIHIFECRIQDFSKVVLNQYFPKFSSIKNTISDEILKQADKDFNLNVATEQLPQLK